MIPLIKYNVKETTSSYGYDVITLGGAVGGYQTFSSVLQDGEALYYYMNDLSGTEWELGSGCYIAGIIYKSAIIYSSNSNLPVNFSAGSKIIFLTDDYEGINGGDTLITEGALIDSATSKTTPADTDMIGLMDSAASNILKKLSWLNLKNTLKTYFDTLYQAILVSGTNIKTINGNSILGSGNITTSGYDPLSEQIFFQDFVFDTSQGSTANYTFGTQGGSGQTGALLSHTYTNAVGVFRLTSGTTASTGLSLQTNPQQIGAFRPSTYAATFVGRINMNQLSDATNRYIIRVGLITAAYNSNPASGIFFRYSDNVNSGKYECVCRNANVETVINTTIAPAISTNWDKLEWRINAAGTSVEFFINNVSQGTIATNIPTTTYLLMWFVLHKVSGASSQLMDIDAYYFKITRTI